MSTQYSYKRWTAEEKALINKAVLDGTKAKVLEKILSGRNRTQIQCQLASARKRLRDGAGGWQDPAEQKQECDMIMAQGVCRWCRERFADFTLISCEPCATRRQTSQVPNEMEITKAQADLLPWIFSRHPGQLVSWLPASRKIVDPFGGSGRLARAAARRHKRIVFNDIHPLLSPYVRALAAKRHADINLVAADLAVDGPNFADHYQKMLADPSDDVMAAATVRLAAFNTIGCRLDKVTSVSFAPRLEYSSDSRLWQQMATETRSWKEVILDHDGPKTSFVLDPPYPKTEYFEHNFTWLDFKDLVETLAAIRGKFIMVVPTRRDIVELAHKHDLFSWMRRVKMYKGAGRDLIVANYRISKDTSLEPVSPERYGLHRTDEQKDLVEEVVKALHRLGAATRREVAEHLDKDNVEVLGALSRARAEGRVVKASRHHYALPDTPAWKVRSLRISRPPMSVAVQPEPPDEFDVVLDALEAGTLEPVSLEELPFRIIVDRQKILGPVYNFVKSLNKLGYEVRFRE